MERKRELMMMVKVKWQKVTKIIFPIDFYDICTYFLSSSNNKYVHKGTLIKVKTTPLIRFYVFFSFFLCVQLKIRRGLIYNVILLN